MQINELKSQNKRDRKKKVGRGGNRGTYSTRGRDGQRSRSGGKSKAQKIKIGRKGYFKSLPYKGGFKSRTPRPQILRLSELLEFLKGGEVKKITLETLTKAGLIEKKDKVKILMDKKEVKAGDVKDTSLEVGAKIDFSESVKKFLGIKDKKKKKL